MGVDTGNLSMQYGWAWLWEIHLCSMGERGCGKIVYYVWVKVDIKFHLRNMDEYGYGRLAYTAWVTVDVCTHPFSSLQMIFNM